MAFAGGLAKARNVLGAQAESVRIFARPAPIAKLRDRFGMHVLLMEPMVTFYEVRRL